MIKPKTISQILAEASNEVSVSTYLSYRNYLKDIYTFIKSNIEGRYSYLQFAEDLGFSKTNVMRLVIIGQRPLTLKAAKKIESALGLTGSKRLYFENLVKHANSRNAADRDKFFKNLIKYKERETAKEIDKNLLSYFSNWLNPVIKETVATSSLAGNPEEIKDKILFPVRLEDVKNSLTLLEEIGLIKKDRKGKYQAAKSDVMTSRQVSSIEVAGYHKELLELAKQSVTLVEPTRRELLAITLRLTDENMKVAKELLHDTLKKILELETENGGEVVQINTQLFPFFK